MVAHRTNPPQLGPLWPPADPGGQRVGGEGRAHFGVDGPFGDCLAAPAAVRRRTQPGSMGQRLGYRYPALLAPFLTAAGRAARCTFARWAAVFGLTPLSQVSSD